MLVIQNNPYRILGLFIGANARGLQKQQAKIKAYSRVGKTITLDTDFQFLEKVERDPEVIAKALNQLEQVQEKIVHALFWFWNYSSIDQVALKHLLQGDNEKAIEIWGKVAYAEIQEPTIKQFAAILNLSTLCFGEGFAENDFNRIENAIKLKGRLFQDTVFKEFVTIIGGDNAVFTADEAALKTCKLIIKELERSEWIIEIDHQVELFENYPTNIREKLIKDAVSKPVQTIEDAIDNSQKERQKAPQKGYTLGNALVSDIVTYLEQIEEIKQKRDAEYNNVATRLAHEIMQCSIVFFNEAENSKEVLKKTFELADTAKNICPPNTSAIKHIEENLERLQGIADNMSLHEEKNEIEQILAPLGPAIEKMDTGTKSIEEIWDFMYLGESIIRQLEELDADRKLIKNVSSGIVDRSLNQVVKKINAAQKSTSIPSSLLSLIRDGETILNRLEKFKMVDELVDRLYKNKETLRKIESEIIIEKAIKDEQRKEEEASKNKTGWYIGLIIIVIIIAIALSNQSDSGSDTNYNSPESSNAGYANDKKEKIYTKTEEGSDTEDFDLRLKKPNDEYTGNQLKNGSSPYNNVYGKGIYSKEDRNWLQFKNGNTSDAIVLLVNYKTDRVTRNEYIRAGATFKMTKIPDGTYFIKFYSGKDWNPHKKLKNGEITGGFERRESYSKSDGYNDLMKLEDNGYQYSTGEITLYQVVNGNMETEKVSERQFF